MPKGRQSARISLPEPDRGWKDLTLIFLQFGNFVLKLLELGLYRHA